MAITSAAQWWAAGASWFAGDTQLSGSVVATCRASHAEVGHERVDSAAKIAGMGER
jgi:hypothetical protein